MPYIKIDISTIIKKWEVEKPLYEFLGESIFNFMKSIIPEYEIFPEITYRTKDLVSIIKKIKKKQIKKEYDYNHLNDKLGIRIVCCFNSQMDIIHNFIDKYFTIINCEKKFEGLEFDKLDYISNHYDVKIKSDVDYFKDTSNLEELIFEIQVKTFSQHAWSNASHSLAYKQEIELSSLIKRKIYRLISLYEIADDEFSLINESIFENENNFVYNLLNSLEKKFYKYAKTDYDKEVSIHFLKIIINFFNNDIKSKLKNDVEVFIKTNDSKIREIYLNLSERLEELQFLTQPEIFLIWYVLSKYPNTIEDNWIAYFDVDDLELIKAIWGRTY